MSNWVEPGVTPAAGSLQAQAAAAARVRGVEAVDEEPPEFGGLVTRALAFAIDAAIIDGVAIVVGVVVGLALSVLGTPDEVNKLIAIVGGAVFVIWSVAYFVVFWGTTGQTPGNRVMHIRVREAAEDRPLRYRRGVVRLAAMVLAAIPLFAGYLTILTTERRRGFHDYAARTLVVSERDSAADQPAGTVSSA